MRDGIYRIKLTRGSSFSEGVAILSGDLIKGLHRDGNVYTGVWVKKFGRPGWSIVAVQYAAQPEPIAFFRMRNWSFLRRCRMTVGAGDASFLSTAPAIETSAPRQTRMDSVDDKHLKSRGTKR